MRTRPPQPGRPNPPFLFRPDGEVFHLRYTEGESTEVGSFPRRGWKGLIYFHHLIGRKGTTVQALELSALTGPGVPETERDRYDLLSREGGGDYGEPGEDAEEVSPIGVRRFEGEEVCDFEALRAVQAGLRVAREEKDRAKRDGDHATVERTEQEIAGLEKYLRDALGTDGQRRKIVASLPPEKARKSVGNAMSDVRRRLERTMPALEKHLHQCVNGQGWGYFYNPPGPGPNWVL